ncbi:hypothetical protein, partial [Duncaniella freteri]|uniref:hypothetical protein n=4 Tax=Duncaniella TaxID=2518495 RepID=UPI00256F083E
RRRDASDAVSVVYMTVPHHTIALSATVKYDYMCRQSKYPVGDKAYRVFALCYSESGIRCPGA